MGEQNAVDITMNVSTVVDEASLEESVKHIEGQLKQVKSYLEKPAKNDAMSKEAEKLKNMSKILEDQIAKYRELEATKEAASKRASELSIQNMNMRNPRSKKFTEDEEARERVAQELAIARETAKQLNIEYEEGRDLLQDQVKALVTASNILATDAYKYSRTNARAKSPEEEARRKVVSPSAEDTKREYEKARDGLKLYDQQIRATEGDLRKLEQLARDIAKEMGKGSRVTASQFAGIKDIIQARYEELTATTAVGNEVKDIDAAIKEIESAVQKTAKSMKGVGSSTKNSTSQTYYLLRSMKMLNEQFKRMSDNAVKLGKTFLTASGSMLKAMGKMIVGFRAFNRSTRETTRSHNGFVSSLKGGFFTVLKYTLGIRSLYMLMRKLRSALSDGMMSLATASTEVNTQMSSIVSNLSWMKNMVATAVQPLLRVLVPVMNAVANAFDRATYAIGSFFAVLTGQTYVYKAIKPMEDYAKAISGAGKAAKDAANGIREWDKLNVLKSKDNSGGGGAVFNQAETEIAASKLAEKVKDIMSTIFDPMKKAWEKEGKFVMDSWKKSLREVRDLIGQIGQDFLTVWANDTGVKIWTNLYHIIGDVGQVIGNLAKQFNSAWAEGEKGLHIFEAIQSLIDIIIQGIRNCADATVEWSARLNFNPLLESTLGLLRALQPVIQTITNILEYFWTHIVLPFRQYIIEEGLPKLLDTLSKISGAIDWDLLTARMQKFMDAFEPFLEKFWETMVIILEDLGMAIADFVNSDTFGKLIDMFVRWMNDADPREMATAIEDLAKSIVIVTVALKGLSVLSGIVVNILTFGNAINNLKNVLGAGGLTTSVKGLSNVFGKMPAPIQNATWEISEMARVLTESGVPTVDAYGYALKDLAGPAGPVVGVGAAILGTVLNFASFTDACSDGISITNELGMVFGAVAATIGAILLGAPAAIAAAVAGVVVVIENFISLIQSQPEKFAETINKIADFIKTLPERLQRWWDTTVIPKIQSFGENLGEKAGECVKKFIDGFSTFPENFKTWVSTVDWLSVGEAIVKGILFIFTLPARLLGMILEALLAFLESFIEGFGKAFDSHSPAKKMYPLGENILNGILEGIKTVIKGIGSWIQTNIFTPFMDNLKAKFGISGNTSSVLSEIGGYLIEGLKQGISSKWEAVKGAVQDVWDRVTQSAKDKFKTHSPSKVFQDEIGANLIAGLQSGISNTSSRAINAMASVASSIISSARSTLSSSTLSEVGRNLISGLGNGISSMASKAVSAMSNVVNQILNVARGGLSSSSLRDVGSNLVSGLSSGISSTVQSAVDSVRAVANRVVSATKSAFKVHSPSRVFMEIGEYLTEGLAIGVEDEAEGVSSVFEDLVPTTDFIDNFYNSFIAKLTEMRQESISIVSSMMNELNALMSNMNDLDNFNIDVASLSKIHIPDIAVGNITPDKQISSSSIIDELEKRVTIPLEDTIGSQNAILTRQNEILIQILAKKTGITSREIFDATRQEATDYFNRTGNSAFIF